MERLFFSTVFGWAEEDVSGNEEEKEKPGGIAEGGGIGDNTCRVVFFTGVIPCGSARGIIRNYNRLSYSARGGDIDRGGAEGICRRGGCHDRGAGRRIDALVGSSACMAESAADYLRLGGSRAIERPIAPRGVLRRIGGGRYGGMRVARATQQP